MNKTNRQRFSTVAAVASLLLLAACSNDQEEPVDIGDAPDTITAGDTTRDTASASDSRPALDVPISDTGSDVGDTDLDDAPDASASDTSGHDAAGADSGDTDAAPTWDNFAQDFFTQYCVECHGAGDSQRDYTTLADIRRDKVSIRCGVAPEQLDDCSGFPPAKQFPVGTGPKPTDAERARLVAWIDAGLPQD